MPTARRRSRQGFYGAIDRVYTRTLILALRHRTAVAVLAVAVIASSYPLYRVVSQEFIPTGGDEAEFELQITAPEGTSLAAMDEITRAVERDVRSVRGVTTLLISAGGNFLGTVNTAQGFIRIAPAQRTGVLVLAAVQGPRGSSIRWRRSAATTASAR